MQESIQMETSPKQVRRLGEELASAELRGDVAFIENALTDDFIGIGPRGFTLTKSEYIAPRKLGDLKYDSLVLDEMKIRVYDDAAVLTGKVTQRARYKSQEASGQFRTTQVFVKQNGFWKLTSLQLSPIVQAP